MRNTFTSLLIVSIAFLSFAPVLANAGQTKTCSANQALPDPTCTPGAVLTTSTIIICKPGYSASVRSVSTSLKKKVFAKYGIPWSQHTGYEVDHLVSLEIGGSNDIANLWPESSVIPEGSFVKDRLENYLHAQVCRGSLSLTEAQREIVTNWLAYYDIDILHQTAPTNPSVVSPTVKTAAKDASTSIVTLDPEVKKSTTGLCHEKGTRYYSATKKFTPYDSLAACFASGGRLPK